MPNDATLYPGIPGPAERQVQRTASLEARVAALESRRDLVVTPFSFTTGGQATVTYYGGRLWVVFGGRVTDNAGVTGQRQLGMDLRINGVGAAGLTGTWVLASALAGVPNAAAAFPLQVGELTSAQLLGTHALVPGNVMTLTAVATFSTTSYAASGLVVEWPQA